MKLPKGYWPRKGDKFVLIAELKHAVDEGEDFAFLALRNRYGGLVDITVGVEDLDLHRIAWRTNDWVRSTESFGVTGQVVAVHEDSVWMKDTFGMMRTFNANALEPIDDPTKRSCEPIAIEPPMQPPPVLELSPDDKDTIIEGGV